jgi:hypothetical protein
VEKRQTILFDDAALNSELLRMTERLIVAAAKAAAQV